MLSYFYAKFDMCFCIKFGIKYSVFQISTFGCYWLMCWLFHLIIIALPLSNYFRMTSLVLQVPKLKICEKKKVGMSFEMGLCIGAHSRARYRICCFHTFLYQTAYWHLQCRWSSVYLSLTWYIGLIVINFVFD